MPETTVPPDVVDEIARFAKKMELTEEEAKELEVLVQLYSTSCRTDPQELSDMIGISQNTWLAWLGMIGTAVTSPKLREGRPEVTQNDLVRVSIAAGMGMGYIIGRRQYDPYYQEGTP